MKKSLILLAAFLALLILPAISAVQVDMKSNLSQDETLIASVSGNFLEKVQAENILLYREHVRVSFIPYVDEIGDKFYVYGQLEGKSSGNYSLRIEGASYFESGETKNDDVIRNFTIADNQAEFLINPGFLETSGNFSISIQNLKDVTITISSYIRNGSEQESGDTGFFASLFGGSSSSSTAKTETQISPGQTKIIPFSKEGFSGLIYAVLETGSTSYEVPVFVSGTAVSGGDIPAFEFQPNQREVSLVTNSSTFIYLYVYNSGDNDLAEISLSVPAGLESYVSVPHQTFNLDSNSTYQIRANISSGADDGIFEGLITAKSENLTADLLLILNFSRAYVPSDDSPFQTCAEKEGDFCNANQTCSGNVTKAADGACCIGGCKPIAGNSGKILGWTLVTIILLLVIAFFVWRFVKAKKPFNLLDFARKK